MATAVSSILKYLENTERKQNFPMEISDDTPKTKKRKLDHLTWEEKLQRKKLKNRVAAQTSRDRKKAKMEYMEQALQQLFSKNELLTAECENLKIANQKLQEENRELYNRLQSPCSSCNKAQSRSVGYETPNGSTESLLLQKGRATHPAAFLSKQRAVILMKIVLSYLLYPIFSTNWKRTLTLTHWNNLPKAFCKTLPKTWILQFQKLIVTQQKALEKWWGKHQQNWNPVGTMYLILSH
ncbi:X-box-binding protein 1 [Diorhabda carinulata]|uniref:X-box-binding protein 1 n=1 Tax=Diorhabda carinulata TaxID=1163345 RepID=UPI0025A1FB3B|nr:X-box-binding protein 1 [Diorhabda carinulata]